MKDIIDLFNSVENNISFCEISEKKKYFHYTKIDSFWKIIETDTLRATNARFSNDEKEIVNGFNLFKNKLKDIKNENLIDDSYEKIDDYIICFCEEEDILSQWRGYCGDCGVCLEFDFKNDLNYYLKVPNTNIVSKKKNALLHKVRYINENFKLDDDINYMSSLDMIKKKEPINSREIIYEAIPHFKNEKFGEEKEHRIIIQNNERSISLVCKKTLDDFIEYRLTGEKNIPYLTLYFNKKPLLKDNKKNINKKCNFEITIYSKEMDKEEKKKIEDKIKIRTSLYNEQFEKEYDFKCTFVVEKDKTYPEIVINSYDDVLQKDAFLILNSLNFGNEPMKAKIWCDGHLPIRRVIIGPCKDQEKIKESIKHYFTHHFYWLTYVDVESSSIPYRTFN